MAKQPRKNLSKPEVEEVMKRQAEAKRLREFVKKDFYPALTKATTSIKDAQILLGSLNNMVMEEFLGEMRKKKFIDLNLHLKLDKKNPLYKEYMDLLGLFSGEDVFTAKELIEGMRNELQMNIDNELKDRKLDTLKTDFLD